MIVTILSRLYKREITFPSKYQAAHKMSTPENWGSDSIFSNGDIVYYILIVVISRFPNITTIEFQ